MITKKEMGYINLWPIKTPYPGIEYSEKILKKLRKCINLYNSKYLNRKYTIQFSNNEEVEFEIQDKNLAHLLGIDYKNMMKDIFDNYRYDILGLPSGSSISSYLLLEYIVENMDRILNYDHDKARCAAINYYKVGIKCDIFSKLADLSNFHYGCINFDKDIYDRENPNIPFTPQSTKFLYTPSDEIISPFFMMGLKKDYNVQEDRYIAETLIASEEPAKFFAGQEVVIPTQILTDDNGILDKKVATPSEKIKMIREYQNLINEYRINGTLNIFGDYFSMLMSSRDDEELVLKK